MAVDYYSLHNIRLEYALGHFDEEPILLQAFKGTSTPVDGKYFYEVLDENQISELAMLFCLNKLDDDEKASIISKYPNEANWNQFNEAYYLEKLEKCKREQPQFVQDLQAAEDKPVDDPAWDKVEDYVQDDLPVGEMVHMIKSEEARKAGRD